MAPLKSKILDVLELAFNAGMNRGYDLGKNGSTYKKSIHRVSFDKWVQQNFPMK